MSDKPKNNPKPKTKSPKTKTPAPASFEIQVSNPKEPSPGAKYFADMLTPYRGWTLSGMVYTEEDYLGLILRDPNDGNREVVIWVLQDPEDNGPGFIETQEGEKP